MPEPERPLDDPAPRPPGRGGYDACWYPVALAGDVTPGQVVGVELLGARVALARTASGEARVSERWCPHLGSDLIRRGAVDGDRLRCTVHDWVFDPDGRCVEVPFAGMTPPEDVRLAVLPTAEVGGVVWAFNGPVARFALPTLDHLAVSALWEDEAGDPWAPPPGVAAVVGSPSIDVGDTTMTVGDRVIHGTNLLVEPHRIWASAPLSGGRVRRVVLSELGGPSNTPDADGGAAPTSVVDRVDAWLPDDPPVADQVLAYLRGFPRAEVIRGAG